MRAQTCVILVTCEKGIIVVIGWCWAYVLREQRPGRARLIKFIQLSKRLEKLIQPGCHCLRPEANIWHSSSLRMISTYGAFSTAKIRTGIWQFIATKYAISILCTVNV